MSKLTSASGDSWRFTPKIQSAFHILSFNRCTALPDLKQGSHDGLGTNEDAGSSPSPCSWIR